MKLKFKKNESKEFLKNEKKNLEAYMAKLGPGEEYDRYFDAWTRVNEELERMSWTYKLNQALPWIGLGVTAVSTIVVPVTLGTLAYRNSEEEGKLKNGDVWRIGTQNQARPRT